MHPSKWLINLLNYIPVIVIYIYGLLRGHIKLKRKNTLTSSDADPKYAWIDFALLALLCRIKTTHVCIVNQHAQHKSLILTAVNAQHPSESIVVQVRHVTQRPHGGSRNFHGKGRPLPLFRRIQLKVLRLKTYNLRAVDS